MAATFDLCSGYEVTPELYFGIGLSFGVCVYLLLSLLEPFLRRRRSLRHFSQHCLYKLSCSSVEATFFCSSLGAALQLMLISSSLLKQSLNNCYPWAEDLFALSSLPQWAITAINVFFFFRVFWVWAAQRYHPSAVTTIRDGWMFAHSVVNVLSG